MTRRADTAGQRTVSGARFATIVLGGPPVGALVFLVTVVIIEGGQVSSIDIVQIGFFVVFMGWIMGLFPAFLAAIAWAFLPKPSAPLPRIGLAAATGACAGAGGVALMAPVLDLPVPPVGILGVLALCGAIALMATAIPWSRKVAD